MCLVYLGSLSDDSRCLPGVEAVEHADIALAAAFHDGPGELQGSPDLADEPAVEDAKRSEASDLQAEEGEAGGGEDAKEEPNAHDGYSDILSYPEPEPGYLFGASQGEGEAYELSQVTEMDLGGTGVAAVEESDFPVLQDEALFSPLDVMPHLAGEVDGSPSSETVLEVSPSPTLWLCFSVSHLA